MNENEARERARQIRIAASAAADQHLAVVDAEVLEAVGEMHTAVAHVLELLAERDVARSGAVGLVVASVVAGILERDDG